MFESFPRGIAVIELVNPKNISTWQLTAMNELASKLVAPSIETFLSATLLRLAGAIDLPTMYRDVVASQRARTIGMIEVRNSSRYNHQLFTMSAFPVGSSAVGVLFEDAQRLTAASSARVRAERHLTQTCEFVGAILWRADPETLQFTYVSPQAEPILGYWLERWTGEMNFWKKHLFPEDRQRVASVCEKILRARSRRDFEFRMTSVHGQLLWFHAAAELAEQPGGRPELVGVMNDITDLKRAEERIRALTSRLMRVQDEERRHISRELHDSLGQYLTSIKINLEIVKRESGTLSEQHRELLLECSETLEKCVQEVRSVSYVLHPPLLDELGLVAALRWYTAGFAERSGIGLNFSVDREFSRLPKEMELALFRITQESLTNIQRHSQSKNAWVTLSEYKDRAEVRIADNGKGIPEGVIDRIAEGKTIEGVGLRGMYERMRELGGRLEIESTSTGTAVSAVLPLQKGEAKPAEADDGEERRSRSAGKPLETEDLRIAGSGTGKDEPEGDPKEERPARSRRPERRRAYRRSR